MDSRWAASRRVAASQVTVPFGWQLMQYPSSTREEVRAIAFAALRRLLYPIARRYIARWYRERVARDMSKEVKMEPLLFRALRQRSVLGSCLKKSNAVDELENNNEQLKRLLDSISYRVYLRGEFIQYSREPSNAVVFVAKGIVKKCSTVSQTRGRVSHDRRLSSSHVEVSITYDDDEGPIVATPSTQCSEKMSVGSIESEALRTQRNTLLSAPTILGECSAVGSFPCTEYLLAESSVVLIGWIPKSAYCTLLGSFPPQIHRSLLMKALETRERLLPHFGCMTCNRMRICPLLVSLSDRDLLQLMEHLVPRVRPAGVQIGEREAPRHIFFIWRGVVCLQQEEAVIPMGGAPPSQPRSRTLFSEGHTFGEWQCMFHEGLGDKFFTLTNVDLYLLPFSVLSSFMKRDQNIRQQIHRAAKVISLTADKCFDGMRFVPPSLDVLKTVVLSPSQVPKLIQRGQGAAGVFSKRVTIANNSIASHVFRPRDNKTDRVNVSPFFIEQLRKMPLVGLCGPHDSFYTDCAARFKLMRYEAGQCIVERGSECNSVILFCQGGAVVVEDEGVVQRNAEGTVQAREWASLPRVPDGSIVGYTCVRRHPWTCSIVAPDDGTEVWELNRVNFVDVLRKHRIERQMHELVLQLMQPLSSVENRDPLLDTQPLLTPSPNSLWSEYRLPNMHPVILSETPRFPIWKEDETMLEATPQWRRSSVV
ncbi:hypothetical protein, conserved [Trypanosoma brucei gambiense DAL972]|uniref:Cyclic nucleotide-binding domain-containing protein n=2 Tax=Trypanosoma brucei TaxID=5691 RepID=D0AAE4_TRYB9|nr:hypothetical protein, conserved [Trypanosoma brucei gambiense DAL972]RHW67823.1 cyclic nucleotide-binding domain containing protein [Trypanosoma brucei equiperdum]CBH18645.1 hypothetical protein, conserved [Trypanosoma brucei gambiense DAL972]|eukprot:XP_011780909.1 hypothetical protein, conserved [Trypanosoma brucei gambiense DAL972]